MCISLPLDFRLRNPYLAEIAGWLERSSGTGDDHVVVHFLHDDQTLLYRAFVTLVMLIRGIAG